MVRQAPVICVMVPPIHLGAWSMALMLWLPFELLLLLLLSVLRDPKQKETSMETFRVLLTSEAHKRSEQTRSSSYLHTNSPDTCTVRNACGFTARIY